MRYDIAAKIASRVSEEEPGVSVEVLHVPDGAPEPYGYIVTVDGERVTSQREWTRLQKQRAGEEEQYAYNLHLPRELARQVHERAKQNGRPFLHEVIEALEHHVEPPVPIRSGITAQIGNEQSQEQG